MKTKPIILDSMQDGDCSGTTVYAVVIDRFLTNDFIHSIWTDRSDAVFIKEQCEEMYPGHTVRINTSIVNDERIRLSSFSSERMQEPEIGPVIINTAALERVQFGEETIDTSSLSQFRERTRESFNEIANIMDGEDSTRQRVQDEYWERDRQRERETRDALRMIQEASRQYSENGRNTEAERYRAARERDSYREDREHRRRHNLPPRRD